MTSVTSVESPRVTGEESAHHRRQGDRPGAEQEMESIVEHGPRVTRRSGSDQYPPQALKETRTVDVIPYDRTSLDPSADYMVENSGCVEARVAWHEDNLNRVEKKSNALFYDRPLYSSPIFSLYAPPHIFFLPSPPGWGVLGDSGSEARGPARWRDGSQMHFTGRGRGGMLRRTAERNSGGVCRMTVHPEPFDSGSGHACRKVTRRSWFG
jgi:hypothetical protein